MTNYNGYFMTDKHGVHPGEDWPNLVNQARTWNHPEHLFGLGSFIASKALINDEQSDLLATAWEFIEAAEPPFNIDEEKSFSDGMRVIRQVSIMHDSLEIAKGVNA